MWRSLRDWLNKALIRFVGRERPKRWPPCHNSRPLWERIHGTHVDSGPDDCAMTKGPSAWRVTGRGADLDTHEKKVVATRVPYEATTKPKRSSSKASGSSWFPRFCLHDVMLTSETWPSARSLGLSRQALGRKKQSSNCNLLLLHV